MPSSWVTGMFFDLAKSESVVTAFERRGIARADISVVMTHTTKTNHFDSRSNAARDAEKVAEGAGVGGTLGGVMGATIAALAAIGTVIALPGLGLIVAGPLAAALAGAGAGAATGGFIGGMLGLGLSEDRATYYQAGLQQGGILIGVRAKDELDVGQLSALIREFGGDEIHVS